MPFRHPQWFHGAALSIALAASVLADEPRVPHLEADGFHRDRFCRPQNQLFENDSADDRQVDQSDLSRQQKLTVTRAT